MCFINTNWVDYLYIAISHLVNKDQGIVVHINDDRRDHGANVNLEVVYVGLLFQLWSRLFDDGYIFLKSKKSGSRPHQHHLGTRSSFAGVYRKFERTTKYWRGQHWGICEPCLNRLNCLLSVFRLIKMDRRAKQVSSRSCHDREVLTDASVVPWQPKKTVLLTPRRWDREGQDCADFTKDQFNLLPSHDFV